MILKYIITFYMCGVIATLMLFATNKIGLCDNNGPVTNTFLILFFSLIFPYTLYIVYRDLRED